MKCPHCFVHIHPTFLSTVLARDGYIGTEGGYPTVWKVEHMACPNCHKAILQLHKSKLDQDPISGLIYPHNASLRSNAPLEVPDDLREDFNEAVTVLAVSPKASAALSRRCLQGLLKDRGYDQFTLAEAITALLGSNTLPKSLAANVDAIRKIGNFAAHPMKDTSSGSIVPVEPHEADWNLDVLETLFDYYYVQPAIDQKKRAALDAKLAQVGKPPIKQ